MTEPILQIQDLQVGFRIEEGMLPAVEGVSFEVFPGETIGIVGESGSGKSVTNLAYLGLLPMPPGVIAGGKALFEGKDLLKLSSRQLAKIRGNRIAMIFQDPMTALNPFLTVAEQMIEVTRRHLHLSRKAALRQAIEMLEKVSIPSASKRIHRYPHEFSGGMRQRVMIAMALSCKPSVLIADEPTTALDVTIQAQILDLMADLQKTEKMAIVFITHDLGVVAHLCHRVAVMYAGKIVEEAPVKDLFAEPFHPYTQGLLASLPRLDHTEGETLTPIPGQPPDLSQRPSGCSFHPRCPHAEDLCRKRSPSLMPSESVEHFHACLIQAKRGLPEGGAVHG
ncbi:Dipeptide ABC transporter ATP-binding protein DppD [Planctomycetales bacterium 10988]|nr:Dipeptide ABC transporter ATP-binding protein DppD [Planctomycetales bacterium 10988]